MTWDAIVVGGGCAGLSAATCLAEKGYRVLVLERSSLLGGRTRSFEDQASGETLDNGQHLFLGCYQETLTYLRRIGTQNLLRFSPGFSTEMIGPHGERNPIKTAHLPAPWHLGWGLLNYRALSFRERLALWKVAKAARRNGHDLRSKSVNQWLRDLGQSPAAVQRLWEPITLATLNIRPQLAPADLFAVVLKNGFLASPKASAVGLSAVGLSQLLGDPARAFLTSRGGEVRLRSVVRRVVKNHGGVAGVDLLDGTHESARCVILAVPPPAARKLVEGVPVLEKSLRTTEALTPSSILSLHVWMERPPFGVPFVGFWDLPFHWAFRKSVFTQDPRTSHLSLVISGAEEMLGKSKEELIGFAEQTLGHCGRGTSAKISRAVVVQEKEATWVPPIGRDDGRLPADTAMENFFLAGDWTETGLPCTIEGAVQSGHVAAIRAAERLRRSSSALTLPAPSASLAPEVRELNSPTAKEVLSSLRDDIVFDREEVTLRDLKRFREKRVDSLVYQSVFHPDADTRLFLRWLIRLIAQSAGVVPSSIWPFYKAKGLGKFQKMTVPAVNVRGMTYDTARALIRAARANNSKTFVFEIANSEMGYTDQRPSEYSSVILGAALREGYAGPIFIQGDHFQFSSKKFAADPEAETQRIKDLTKEAIEAGFYNIDIDASTLVDLSQPTLDEQQRVNYMKTVEMTRFIRDLEPKGVTVSVGGEIGEVGGKNSTVDELRAYLDGYVRELNADGKNRIGISKVSVQTGTSHGGVPLPDGTVAQVALDFGVLAKLSEMAITSYHLAGAVQHGASTLPDDLFHRFPETNTAEIHLATGFQNLTYDSVHFPKELYAEILEHLKKACADERKPGQTEGQFFYKTRKKGFGPFKKKIWDLPVSTREALGRELEAKFDFLFKKLAAVNTHDAIVNTVEPVKVLPPLPERFRPLLAS